MKEKKITIINLGNNKGLGKNFKINYLNYFNDFKNLERIYINRIGLDYDELQKVKKKLKKKKNIIVLF